MKAIILFFVLVSMSSATQAAGPSVWSVNSRADVLKGDARGVSIDENGAISLAPRLAEIYRTEQSYAWATAVDSSGTIYVGTGGDGKVFRITNDGRASMLADLSELNVTAIAIGRAGEVFAGTSPDGKVYRIDSAGASSVYFSPAEKYIWALAAMPDGSLAVATGDQGRIYKVSAANAAPASSLLFDTSETHVISLAADRAGNLYAGTDANGLVMRFGADARPFGLLDSPLREIHELAVGADGSVYALALGESASAPKPAEAAAAPAATPESRTVTVEKPSVAPETPAKSRYDLTGAKSAVYRMLPDGSSDLLWASTTVSGFSIASAENGVMLGTSDKGRILRIANDGRETLLVQTDANQISTLRMDASGFIATSSNPASVYRIGNGTAAEGTYESAVLDAKASASWGRLWWRSNGNVTIQTRSGNTQEPDETWSQWSAAVVDQKGGQVASPKARYLQWRATLRGPSAASLNEVSVAFTPRNIAPEILSITVLPTNVGLVANPPAQIDPNIELSGLDPVTFGIASTVVAPRRVYQRGATSLQWTAEDRNGDKLIYDVQYKQVGDADFKLLRGGLTENFIAIDGQSLADGRYIFKIAARDNPSNPTTLALTGERTTEPIEIDNTAPTVSAVGNPQVSGNTARVSFETTDASSYITRAEYSINGGEWRTVYADDGIADSSKERFTVEFSTPAAGDYAVTIRVFDVNGNSGNSRTVVRK